MNLTQSGKRVTGTETRVSPTDSEYFADLLFHGTLKGSKFYLQDDSITAKKAPSNYNWLLYAAALHISADGQMMKGPWHSGRFSGTMILKRLPPPRITLNTAQTRDHNSVTIDYSISTAAVTHPLRFDVYRSKTNRLDTSSKLIGSQTLAPSVRAKELAIGKHRVRLISGTPLTANARFPYIIVVANRNGEVDEAADSLNTAFFSLS